MTYDPDLIDRLVREVREDDATIPRCWEVEHDRHDQPNIYSVDLHAGGRYWVALLPHQCVKPIEDEQNATAVALVRVRDNLAAMADQLEAARREVERLGTVMACMEVKCSEVQSADLILELQLARMRPVVEAADRYIYSGGAVLPLKDAIDAYRAAKVKT